ncbi:MAG: hypothetical protein ACYS80_27795, partial [Planctomycetota bacterium]
MSDGKTITDAEKQLRQDAERYVDEVYRKTDTPERYIHNRYNLIRAVEYALRREREQFTEIINSAISWLETVSSSDGSGHADLAKRLKKMSENMAPRPDPIAERLERLLDELYDDSIGSYPEQAAHVTGWNAALEAIRFHMEG